MNWQDIEDIAIKLEETHPKVDNLNLRFKDLHKWIMELDGFVGSYDGSNEKILEAIQMAWLEERQDKEQ